MRSEGHIDIFPFPSVFICLDIHGNVFAISAALAKLNAGRKRRHPQGRLRLAACGWQLAVSRESGKLSVITLNKY